MCTRNSFTISFSFSLECKYWFTCIQNELQLMILQAKKKRGKLDWMASWVTRAMIQTKLWGYFVSFSINRTLHSKSIHFENYVCQTPLWNSEFNYLPTAKPWQKIPFFSPPATIWTKSKYLLFQPLDLIQTRTTKSLYIYVYNW